MPKAKTKHAPPASKTNVINFPNRKPADHTITLRPANAQGNFFSHAIHTTAFQRFGIDFDDRVIFTDTFKLSEIKPLSFCLIRIDGHKQMRPIVVEASGEITVFEGDKTQTFHRQEIEILGVAVQLVRSLI